MLVDGTTDRGAWLAGLLVTTVLFAGCQAEDRDGGPDSPPTDPGTAGASEAVTTPPDATPTGSQPPSPTETPPPAKTPTAADMTESQRELLVTPQEPVTVASGEHAEFGFVGRLGEAEADPPALVGFGWLPCETVNATRSGPLPFPDDDGDGHANPMGTSDTGSTRLFTVNGERYENVDDEWPVMLHTTDRTPPVEIVMRSSSPDCTTLVFFLDEDGDEEFDVAADGTLVEAYGVAEARWEG